MTEQKKIRKIASDICLVKQNCNDVCNPTESCSAYKHAKKAVDAGYSPKPEMTETCPFCAELAFSKDNEEYHQKCRPTADSKLEYTAALVSRRYYNDYPTGQVTGYGHTLNYCPVCGKLLMEAKYEPKNDNC